MATGMTDAGLPELRCPNCARLLARGRVEAPIEMACPRCHAVAVFLPGHSILIRPGNPRRTKP